MSMKADKVLPEGWREHIDESMRNGAALVELFRDFDITPKTHAKLLVEDHEYAALIERGKILSEAWWTEQGRSNLGNKNYNNTMFIFTMKNRFGWTDRVVAGPNGEKPMPDKVQQEEIDAQFKVDAVQ